MTLKNDLSNEDKTFLEALYGEVRDNSIKVLHSTRGLLFASGLGGLYDPPDLLLGTEQLEISPILCKRQGGPRSVDTLQRSIWISVSQKNYDCDALLVKLGRLPYTPSAIIDTVEKVEAIWLLSETLSDTYKRDQAEWTMRWLTTSLLGKSWGDDSSRGGLHFAEEFISIPGTTNYSLPSPKAVKLIQSNLGLRYRLFDLMKMTLYVSDGYFTEASRHLDLNSICIPNPTGFVEDYE